MEDEIDNYDNQPDAEKNQPVGEVIEDVVHFFRNVNVDGKIGGSMILRILWRNGDLTENGFAETGYNPVRQGRCRVTEKKCQKNGGFRQYHISRNIYGSSEGNGNFCQQGTERTVDRIFHIQMG